MVKLPFHMACRLCGADAPLVQAHIIPEAFFRELRADGGLSPLLVSGDPATYNKAAPIGVYDQTILCAACEGKFQTLDDYGIEAMLRRFGQWFAPVQAEGVTHGFESAVVDQERLLKFLVAVLWRASVSTHSFYRNVSLGPLLAAAARVVIDPHQPTVQTFGAVLSRWSPPANVGFKVHGLMDPFREKWRGVNAYRLYFGDMVAYIRVDRRPFPPALEALALTRQSVLRVVERAFENSKDYGAMHRTAMLAHRREEAARLARSRRKGRG